MHARGDMMPKAVNLSDMLWRQDAAQADRAKAENGAAQGLKPAAKRLKAEFIPEQAEPAPKGAAKSFQERVKESQARMSKKDHTFFKQPGRPDAQPEAKAPEDRPAKIAKPGQGESFAAEAPAAGRAAAAATAERTHRPMGRKDVPQARDCESKSDAPAAGSAASARPGGLEAPAEHGFASGEEGTLDYDALEARLEELGIEASPEQLRDPAFLAEMLWMIDALPLATPVVPEVAAATAAVEGDAVIDPATAAAQANPALQSALAADVAETAPAARGAVAREGVEAEAAAVPADSFDWTAVEEGEREEIAALIREKLGALADKAAPGPEAAAARTGAADLPASVQLARAGAMAPLEIEAPAADATLADPDRLRVLQSAAFAGPVADDRLALSTDPDYAADADSEEADAAGIPSLNLLGASDEDSEEKPDLMGRDSGQARASEAFAGRDQAAAKDAAAPTFQSSLDQVRAAEARMAQAKQAALPHPQLVHEQNVLAQIAKKLSGLGVRGNEEIRIQLEPEHLGKVRIALEMRGEGLTARIGVENDAVRQMVDANLAALKDSLENQGIKIQGMEVSVEHRHASLFNPDGSNAREFFRQRGQGGQAADATLEAQDGSAESDTGRRMGYNTMEYIA